MCSRIQWTTNGQPVIVRRNMDWTARMGTKLWVMPKGIERNGVVPLGLDLGGGHRSQ